MCSPNVERNKLLNSILRHLKIFFFSILHKITVSPHPFAYFVNTVQIAPLPSPLLQKKKSVMFVRGLQNFDDFFKLEILIRCIVLVGHCNRVTSFEGGRYILGSVSCNLYCSIIVLVGNTYCMYLPTMENRSFLKQFWQTVEPIYTSRNVSLIKIRQ